jgi:crotonobetainyl-CoA:carnitine CoA-transferase CaiB-like acyl-CoA transferase
MNNKTQDEGGKIRPLDGLRVLDISRALAGPFCTMMLGDLGADVIKVERPGRGDESRSWGPPFVGVPNDSYPGESTYYLAANRSKRSLTVNLKSPEGQEIIKRLAAVSDVLVENYLTGSLDKMGLGYEQLHELNPRLVYCSISGYGRSGPYAGKGGYDFILQAEGGIMGITGPVEGPPFRVGVSIIDITTGMFASTAILAALRARDVSGEGQLLDLSLLDSSAAILANVASNYLIGGVEPRRMGNAHFNIAPYEVYRARDRWLTLGALNQRQWENLCTVVDRQEIIADPLFASNQDRVENRASLAEVLNEAFAARDAREWIEELHQVGIPSGVINTIADVFNHPQAQERELKIEIEHPTAGVLSFPGYPYKFSETPAQARRPPPLLGEHTDEVLSELLEYSPEELLELHKRGAI